MRLCVHGYLSLWVTLSLIPARPASAAGPVGGNISVTSDFIYRGLSESNGHPAVQVDLYANSRSGNFAGVWASTRDRHIEPRADYDAEIYAGHRFDLGSAWSATLTALSYSYLGGRQGHSNDYQELSASMSYLDRWTFSVSAIPNAVRYRGYYRIGRYPAYVVETTGQWLLRDRLFLTGGAGYYSIAGAAYDGLSGTGYAYGNLGLGFGWRRWRLDIGYFLTQQRAQMLFPYPLAHSRVAGTLNWRF